MYSTKITNSTKLMKGVVKGILSLVIVGACLAAIPVFARMGLLILSTAPDPRHPPGDVMGEAVGWAIVGTFVGAVSIIIGEATVMREGRGIWGNYKGIILGSVSALLLGAFLGMGLAVVQMDSVDGQAITSASMAVWSGGVVGMLGAMGGIVIGAILKRLVTAFFS